MKESEYKYMVCTQCFTFNHAPYIVDAMNGFVMQKTTFPVITIIVDDASTDGEQEVIRNYLAEHFQSPYRTDETEYARIICARHKTNNNCEFVVVLLKYNHFSIKKSKFPYLSEWLDNAKYHAICEGDDYWVDNEKLQIQFDAIELHPNMRMCTHAYKVVTDFKSGLGDTHTLKEDGILDTGLVIENVQCPQTASFFYRSELQKEFPQFFKKLDVGDYPLRVYAAITGGIYYIDRVMSCYRKYSSE